MGIVRLMLLVRGGWAGAGGHRVPFFAWRDRPSGGGQNEVTLVNAPDEHGNTPLHVAAAAAPSRTNVCRALIEAGAVLHSANHEGHTPLDLARRAGHADIAACVGYARVGGAVCWGRPRRRSPRRGIVFVLACSRESAGI